MIDLSLAIWKINPSAEYRLSQSNPPHSIIEWRGPGPQPSEIEIYEAWLKCTTLTADRIVIPADGVTPATITVRTGEQEPSIDLLVAGAIVKVPLSGGVGTLQIARQVPTLPPHIVVRAQNQAVYGDAVITIKATE
jgi:hypothetical protein